MRLSNLLLPVTGRMLHTHVVPQPKNQPSLRPASPHMFLLMFAWQMLPQWPPIPRWFNCFNMPGLWTPCPYMTFAENYLPSDRSIYSIVVFTPLKYLFHCWSPSPPQRNNTGWLHHWLAKAKITWPKWTFLLTFSFIHFPSCFICQSFSIFNILYTIRQNEGCHLIYMLQS